MYSLERLNIDIRVKFVFVTTIKINNDINKNVTKYTNVEKTYI